MLIYFECLLTGENLGIGISRSDIRVSEILLRERGEKIECIITERIR